MEGAREGLGQAIAIARHLPNSAAVGDGLVQSVKEAFVFGMHRGYLVAGLAALVGSAIAARWLPARELVEPAADSAGDPMAEAEPVPVD